MKVILSRKGFDSANGVIPNPILGIKMLPLPIPKPQYANDKVRYEDLQFEGYNVRNILKDLGYDNQKKNKDKTVEERECCHLDPDLVRDRRKNCPEGWKAAFGQSNSSAKYLINKNVDEGDLFLFFGTFRFIENKNGTFTYAKAKYDDYRVTYNMPDKENPFYGKTFHAIWGYMWVEKVLKLPDEIKEYKWHPHASATALECENNRLYIPKECGIFDFDKKRVLTKEGMTKAKWDLPEEIISAIERENKAKNSGYAYYPGIWQELVIEDNEDVRKWAMNFLKNSYVE